MRRVVSLTVLMVVIALSASVFAADKKLRVVGSWGSKTLFKDYEKPFYTETVPKELGMKVSLTTLEQVKLKGPAVLRQMKLGVFDVVHTVADYVVADSPGLAGLDLPALAPDIPAARRVVDAYRPIMAKYLERDFNVKLISVIPYAIQILFIREKINDLNDLKGMKIRASGWTSAEFISSIGATGVTLNFSEVPQALQRGVVDGGVTGGLSGYLAGWGEVTSYVYPLPMGGWDYCIGTMNMDTWNALGSEKQKKLMKLISEKLEKPAWGRTERETVDGLACLSDGKCPYGKNTNLTVIPYTSADEQRAKRVLIENVLPAWSKKVDAKTLDEWYGSIGKVVGIQR